MKAFAFLIAALVFPGSAFAVKVSECPEKITLSYGRVQALPVQKILNNEKFTSPDPDQVKKIRDALGKINSVEIEAKISSRQNSVCTYLSTNEKAERGYNEIRLTTKSGRDVLRVAVNLKIASVTMPQRMNEYVWVYHDVSSYSPQGLVLSPRKGAKVLGYDNHGALHVHVGWVNEISTGDKTQTVNLDARIRATDSEGKKAVISLDEDGELGAGGRSPTIKDFEDDVEYSKYCVEGSDKSIRDLLEALVLAADADGDSYAELNGIVKKASAYEVTSTIVRGSGDSSEELTFRFPICR